jgi:hypothetical protein
MYVAHCDSAMAVANDSHFAKDFSNPDLNIALFGRNLSSVRGYTVIEISNVIASLAFHLLDLYKDVSY